MKIGIHANELDGRGIGRVCRDYAAGLIKRGHEVALISSANSHINAINQMTPNSLHLYDHEVLPSGNDKVRGAIARIVDREKIDFLHVLSYGKNNGIVPDNCRTGVHAIFDMSEPHGDIYVGVSEYLCRKFGRPVGDYVPHIVEMPPPTEDWRVKFGIPNDAVVLGRHGGYSEFDIGFVQQAVIRALNKRDNLWFLFLSTEKFVTHERAIFVPWVESKQEVANFIHACDGMIHGRMMGETFGLAPCEFSAAGRLVITWSGMGNSLYDKAHVDHLHHRTVPYTNGSDLDAILKHPGLRTLSPFDRFSEKHVMDIYERVFLKQNKKEPPMEVKTERLDDIFDRHGSDKGRIRHNYGKIYEFLLERYRDRQIKILEIGIYGGASMRSWLEYLPCAHVVGVDLGGDFNPNSLRASVEIGDQSDTTFLDELIDKHGPFDVIIDDGSHKPGDQQTSFKILWPHVKSGGVYVIEDTEVSYEQGFQSPGFMPTTEYFKGKITEGSLTVGKSDPWVLFAGELIAIFKR